MSQVVQIDAVQLNARQKEFSSQHVSRTLFSPRNAGKTLLLRDDQGAIFEVTLDEIFYTSSATREGGPVRVFEAFFRDLERGKTVFRYAVLKVYKGYDRAVLCV